MNNLKKLVLLHSNDMHGDFLAEDADNKLVGGISRLSGYIGKVREEEPNVLYAVAGDMFRGSVIDSEYLGLSTIEIMNMLAPDVVTIGNHETDYGVAHLLFIEKCANFPIVNANLHITMNGARLFKPYTIIEIGGMKVLFIGVLTQDVIAQTKNDGIIGSFVNAEDAAKEVGRICNAYNAVDIDFTVLLTHIGYEEDKKLASMLDPSWGVDVIIGGHSHTLPEEAVKVNDVLIVQAGTGTDRIGRFDLTVDTDRNCLYEWEWKTVPIDSTHCPADPKIEELIAAYKSSTDEKYGRVVTRFEQKLTHPDRWRETDLGDLFADILMESLGVDVFLLGSGSIRDEELGPIVTYGDLTKCFPYNDAAYQILVTGAQLKRMLRYMLRDEAWEGEHTEFYQLSDGLKVTYSIPTREMDVKFRGEPLADDRILKLGLQNFHYNNLSSLFGVDEEEIAANGQPRQIATACLDILEEYMMTHQRLSRKNEGRLVIIRE